MGRYPPDAFSSLFSPVEASNTSTTADESPLTLLPWPSLAVPTTVVEAEEHLFRIPCWPTLGRTRRLPGNTVCPARSGPVS